MLTERFKKYLEQQFRTISPTREAMEYREEVLRNLLDRAQEYRIKGMTDENAIYDLCIDSLGDFASTLKDFESRLDNVKRALPKAGIIALCAVAFSLFVVIAYLTVSFATKAWDKTWLIFIAGVFTGVIACALYGIVKFAKRKKRLAVRGLSHVIIVAAFTMLFLFLEILSNLPNCYFVFLIMVIAMLVTDTAEAYSYGSKSRLFDLLATVEVTAVLVYVILGIAGVVAWHPYWLIPVIAALLDVIILIVAISRFAKKKKKATEEKKSRVDEAYYTMWNDENK